MLQWLAAESSQYIGTATQLQWSMNGPLVWKTEKFMRIHLSCENGFSDSHLISDPETEAEQHRMIPVFGECRLNAPKKYQDQDSLVLPCFQRRSRYIVHGNGL